MKTRFLLCFIFVPCLWCQQNDTCRDAPAEWRVKFETSNGKAVLAPSIAMAKQPHCRGSMCYAAFVLEPRNSLKTVVVAFDFSGQSRQIDPSTLPNLTLVQMIDLAPTADGDVVLLIHASPHDGRESHFYLAEYDSRATFKGLHLLNDRIAPERIASLSGDQVLVLGFDTFQKKALLAIVKTDGELLRILDDQGALPTAGGLLAGSPLKFDANAPDNLKAIGMSVALSSFDVSYAANRVIVLSPGERASIWSIRGLDIRKVNLKLPEGMRASTMVPTDGPLLVRAFDAVSGLGMLLEFDLETGALKRKIDSSGTPPTSIFDEEDGRLYALWSHDNKTFIVESSPK